MQKRASRRREKSFEKWGLALGALLGLHFRDAARRVYATSTTNTPHIHPLLTMADPDTNGTPVVNGDVDMKEELPAEVCLTNLNSASIV